MIPLENSPEVYSRAARRFYVSIPIFLLVPICFWLVFRAAELPMNWSAFGIGALGWWLALVLRVPVTLLMKNFAQKRATLFGSIISGPAEEIVRLITLLLTGASFQWAASLGQGWAAIEVVFTIINGIALNQVVKRTDEKAQKAKEFLESTGNLSHSPLWGVTERIFASAYHIGSTLLIAWNPWLVVVMIPTHSAFNFLVTSTIKKSFELAMFIAVLFGTVVLTFGVIAFS